MKAFPVPAVKRLPMYLPLLEELQKQGLKSVSCTVIANAQKLDPTSVRKDIALTGITGRPKVGYVIQELIDRIEEFLGWKNSTAAFLVGAGHLGTALMGFDSFKDMGLNIVAAFDNDPDLKGKRIHNRDVLHVSKLKDLALRMHIHIGVITTPSKVAQEIADVMFSSGIRAIWNFSSARLDVPEGILVENVDLRSSLAMLTSKLQANLK